MPVTSVVAIIAGVATLGLVAALNPGRSADWEARAAVGFLGVIIAGPVWILQGVMTLLGGTGWLWAWWVAAPLLGLLVPKRAPGPRPVLAGPTVLPGLGEALRLEMVLGWQELGSPAGWEPSLTPSFPQADGGRVWFCFAVAAASPTVVRVAAPWARISLPPGASAPRRTLLSQELEPLGEQAIFPVDPQVLGREYTLEQWRAHNPRIAAHPLLAELGP